MLRLQKRAVRLDPPMPGQGKLLAIFSLLAWAVAILAGRLLAYTCKYLMWDSSC